MSRNLEIDKILEAWWELDHCIPPEKANAQSRLNQLLDAVVAKSENLCTRHQVQDALWGHYKSYRAAIYKASTTQVAQTALKKD